MRPLKLTIFLIILTVVTVIGAAPIVWSTTADLLTLARAGQLGTPEAFLAFIVLLIAGFVAYLIVMLFKMRAWARNAYIGWFIASTGLSIFRSDFHIVPTIIMALVLAFVFYSCWDEFD